MSWTLSDSGTTSALTIGTETTLATDTNNGVFQPEFDLTNAALGEVFEIRAYTIVLSGGSYVQCLKGTFQGGCIINNHKAAWPIMSDRGIRYTIKQLNGTGRTIPWKVLRQGSVTLSASGTQSLTVGTQATLATDTNNGTFQFIFDGSNFVLGDQFSAWLQSLTLSGGSYAYLWQPGSWSNNQINPCKISPPVSSDQGIKALLEQLAGTARSVPWKLLRI